MNKIDIWEYIELYIKGQYCNSRKIYIYMYVFDNINTFDINIYYSFTIYK